MPILALTATATQKVIDDVIDTLKMHKPIILKSPFNRPNLFYEVREKADKAETVLEDIVTLIKNEFKTQSGIIYCYSKKECETVSDFLNDNQIASACYHADVSSNNREDAHNGWYANRIKVIVATIAFGMGINKPDVRFVIHHSISKSIEGYYQESGRAGRDGQVSRCIIYYRYHFIFSGFNYVDLKI